MVLRPKPEKKIISGPFGAPAAPPDRQSRRRGPWGLGNLLTLRKKIIQAFFAALLEKRLP
jgi:hypothetical protein